MIFFMCFLHVRVIGFVKRREFDYLLLQCVALMEMLGYDRNTMNSKAHKKYKVFFHHGDELGLKTRVSKGKAWIDDRGLNITGPNDTTVVARAAIKDVELFRLHGLGRVIRVDHNGGRLFLSVVRFMIGQFATINFFQTGKLHKALAGPLDTK
jgi:hypothetical protein